jgi:hypothetical protein
MPANSWVEGDVNMAADLAEVWARFCRRRAEAAVCFCVPRTAGWSEKRPELLSRVITGRAVRAY